MLNLKCITEDSDQVLLIMQAVKHMLEVSEPYGLQVEVITQFIKELLIIERPISDDINTSAYIAVNEWIK